MSPRSALDAEVTSLALAAGLGDRVALGEFIARTQADVWRFLAHLTDADTADDLAQETYLRAMDALPGFRGEAPARSWLLTIARRLGVGHLLAIMQFGSMPHDLAEGNIRLMASDVLPHLQSLWDAEGWESKWWPTGASARAAA